jgi:hypothetical protein
VHLASVAPNFLPTPAPNATISATFVVRATFFNQISLMRGCQALFSALVCTELLTRCKKQPYQRWTSARDSKAKIRPHRESDSQKFFHVILQLGMHVKRVRLYFNRAGDKPWSLDSGPGTKELQVNQVSLRNIAGRAIFSPASGDNLATPTAWLELYDCEVALVDGEAILS